jgi:hypothetical protein
MSLESSVKTLIKNHASSRVVDALRLLRYKHAPIRSVFTKLYYEPVADRDSLSGSGSDLIQTAVIARELPRVVGELGIETMLDAPCGDFYWMRHVKLNLTKYVGVDVIRELVMRNAERFGGNGKLFMCLDVTTDKLPQVDLIFSRDMTVHLSTNDAIAALRNFTGEWRPLNLQRAPFNFPEPLRLINERCTEEGDRYADKSLGLWRLSDLPNLTFQH